MFDLFGRVEEASTHQKPTLTGASFSKNHVTTLQSMLGFQEGSNLLIFAYNKLYGNHHFCSSFAVTNPLLYLWAGLTLQAQEPPASHSLIIVDMTQAVTHP